MKGHREQAVGRVRSEWGHRYLQSFDRISVIIW